MWECVWTVIIATASKLELTRIIFLPKHCCIDKCCLSDRDGRGGGFPLGRSYMCSLRFLGLNLELRWSFDHPMPQDLGCFCALNLMLDCGGVVFLLNGKEGMLAPGRRAIAWSKWARTDCGCLAHKRQPPCDEQKLNSRFFSLKISQSQSISHSIILTPYTPSWQTNFYTNIIPVLLRLHDFGRYVDQWEHTSSLHHWTSS